MDTPEPRTHRIPFGMDPSDRMLAVREVPKGIPCQCVCPCCKKPLVARKGHIRTHHFAHAPGVTPCLGGPETALHQMAKQIVAEAASIVLPAMSVREPEHLEPGQSKACEAVACPAETMCIRQSRVEATEHRFRPDVGVSDGEKEIWIEIRVAHRVSHHKQEQLRGQGTACLEIDIRNTPTRRVDEDRLQRTLVENVDRKMWIAHRGEPAARERAQSEWIRKKNERHDRARQKQTSARKPVRRFEEPTPRPRSRL